MRTDGGMVQPVQNQTVTAVGSSQKLADRWVPGAARASTPLFVTRSFPGRKNEIAHDNTEPGTGPPPLVTRPPSLRASFFCPSIPSFPSSSSPPPSSPSPYHPRSQFTTHIFLPSDTPKRFPLLAIASQSIRCNLPQHLASILIKPFFPPEYYHRESLHLVY